MKSEKFIIKFRECFNQTPPDAIQFETEFRQLEEWNSMMALIVIAMVDGDFNKILTADDIRSSTTVNDLFQRIALT